MTKRRGITSLIIYYFWYFSMTAVFLNFLVAYYRSIGLEAGGIGIIQAVGPFVSIFFQPIWGQIGDRAKTKNRVLIVALILYTLIGVSIPLSRNFLFIVAISGLMSFASSPVLPLSDTIAHEYTLSVNFPYGRIRLFGTLGFAVIAYIMGILADIEIYSIFVVFGIVGIFSVVSALFLPKVAGHRQAKQKTDWSPIIKNKSLLLLIFIYFMIQLTMSFFNNFQAMHYEQLGLNFSLLGLSMVIQTISEFPTLFFAHKLISYFGSGRLMLISGGITVLRWIMMFFATDTVFVLLLQLLHGPCFVITMVIMTTYVSQNIAPQLKATGQMVISLFGNSMSRIVGSLLGGFLIDFFGTVRPIFILCAISLTVACVVFWYFYKRVGGFAEDGVSENVE